MLKKLLSFFISGKNIEITTKPIEIYPKNLNKNCGDGLARLYDECGDQRQILEQAQQTANEQNKRVLIVYGTEWCIWDHVFRKHIQAEIAYFNYQWRNNEGKFVQWEMNEKVTKSDYQDAEALNNFVADNFVVAYIECHYTNGQDVLEKIGYKGNIHFIPCIMALNKEGQFVDNLDSSASIKGLEMRKSGGQEYRGYNRKILLTKLQALRKSAE